LITLGLLMLVRLGIFLPVPGINLQAFAEVVKNNQFFSFLDYFSGGGFSALGIFALGIIPYINASIILQLLTAALPSLERLQKDEGEAGRRKISQITRYVALGWAILQSFALAMFVNSAVAPTTGVQVATNPGPLFIAQMVVALTAGSMFVMWVSELITERGVGNGASLLIFLGIAAVLPSSLSQTIDLAQSGGNISGIVAMIVVFLVMIVGIVFVQEGSRRIPIVYARRQVGRRMYREQTSYLPLRLNQGGVMPIIFASAVLILPSALAQNFSGNETLVKIVSYLSPGGPQPWVYVSFYLFMIVFFSYFYSSLVLNPVDLSQNLKKMGASIPGIRPGRATTEYIERVMNRLTLLGAFFLGGVALIPTAVESATRVTTFQSLGATSLLILVGVAIDTAKQIQTYVISQRYEGMVKQ
jgi:preprotein translocase subunit SecY